MPFTFSHPAAVLPLTYLPKRWFSMTGLVIGSMTPDFEYFIRLKVHSSYSHTWTGILWFDLPLTIILAFIFHTVVRNNLIDNLPTVLKNRLVAFKNFQWTDYFKRKVFVVVLSCILGTMTHIIWDGFTHQHGQFVGAIGALQNTTMLAGHEIPVYKILQHISTLIGGLCIVYAFVQLPIEKPSTKTNPSLSYWASVTIITLTVVVLRIWLEQGHNLLGNVIVTAITGVLVGLILTPPILRVTYNGR
jgi:hypothetical protein